MQVPNLYHYNSRFHNEGKHIYMFDICGCSYPLHSMRRILFPRQMLPMRVGKQQEATLNHPPKVYLTEGQQLPEM